MNNIGSVVFSSGFAGSGWGIIQNLLTGNIEATFDGLTIRKKQDSMNWKYKSNLLLMGLCGSVTLVPETW